MRKVITSASLLLFSIHLLAQETKLTGASETKPFKHELGLNLFSITNVGAQKNSSSNVQPDNAYGITNYNVPSGVYYKLHSGKNALRLSYDYFQKSYTQSEDVDLSQVVVEIPNYPQSYTTTYTGTKKEHEFKIGYQRTIGTKRFTGFLSADLIAGYNKLAGSQEFTWHPAETYAPIPFYYEQYKAGIALGGGLKFMITKRMSLTYEFSCAGMYTRTKNLAYKNTSPTTDLSLKINPVRMIGLGYSF